MKEGIGSKNDFYSLRIIILELFFGKVEGGVPPYVAICFANTRLPPEQACAKALNNDIQKCTRICLKSCPNLVLYQRCINVLVN